MDAKDKELKTNEEPVKATAVRGDASKVIPEDVMDHVITARSVTESNPKGEWLEPEGEQVKIGGDLKITRRGLIAGCVGVAALFAVGGAGVAFAGDGGLIRPPGGQDEANLLGACIKCDRCRSVCPLNAVSVAHIEDGIVNARTPKMDYDLGYCDFCEDHDGLRCVQECPTGALKEGFDPTIDVLGLAEVDVNECLLYRPTGMCSKQCITACPYGAISQNQSGGLDVEEALCNGCGKCHYVCPSASYGTYTGSNLRGINIWPVKEGQRG